MNQNQQLIKYLKSRSRKGITQFEADVLLGIARLSERVRECEAMGYIFHKRWEQKQGRFRQVRFKRYWLIKEK
jgi:predicted transcriptional regulator